MWAARSLSPIIWVAPFGLAPLASALGSRRFALVCAPFVASALIGGWAAYGELVAGPRIVQSPAATGEAERALRDLLRREHVQAATSSYWLAYRLAFLFEEDPVVVPWPDDDQRYEAWRARFDADPRRASIFHPERPRNTPDQTAEALAAGGEAFDRVEVAGFTVLLTRPR